MKRKSAYRVSAILAAALAPVAFRASTAAASLLIAEGFDYPTGVNPAGFLAGNTEAAASQPWDLTGGSAASNIQVSMGSLTYTGGNAPPVLPGDSIGDTYDNMVKLTNASSGTADRISLTNIYSSSASNSAEIYYSMLIDISSITGLSTATTGAFIAGLNNQTGTQGTILTAAGTALCVRQGSTGTYQLGIAQNANGGLPRIFNSSSNFSTGQTLFIVGTYSFNSSGDVSNLYVFNGSNPVSATEPSIPFATCQGNTSSGMQIQSFFLRNNASAPGVSFVDDIRVGTSYADVVSGTSVNITGNINIYWDSATSGVWDAHSYTGGGAGTANWFNSGATLTFINGDSVLFTDPSASVSGGTLSSTLQNNITLNSSVSPTAVIDQANHTNYNISGTGSITGSGGLNMSGNSILTLSTDNTYTGQTNVILGTLVLASANAFPTNTSLNISSGAQVTIANHSTNATLVPIASSLSNNGTIDITNNAMVIHNGSIGTISTEAATAYGSGTWTGTNSSGGVITSSIAAADTTHLTAVGVATGLTAFEAATVLPTDVLIKYTYYGDANLDGKVDGTDYSRIDNGFLSTLSGWYNGDFNYDGVIDGSDYTLIDNSYNTQGPAISAELAVSTAEIAGSGSSAVPEPASLSLLAIGAASLLGRQRRAR